MNKQEVKIANIGINILFFILSAFLINILFITYSMSFTEIVYADILFVLLFPKNIKFYERIE